MRTASYNIGRRYKCSYRHWTIPLYFIRIFSLIQLLSCFTFQIYSYFFQQQSVSQWLDLIDIFLLLVTYLFVFYFHLNLNLYHPTRPLFYTLWFWLYFLVQNYDCYKIYIHHMTLFQTIYVSIRQVALGLITINLTIICVHSCATVQRQGLSTRISSINYNDLSMPNERNRLLDVTIIQPSCHFRIRSLSSTDLVNEDDACISELFTFSWFNKLMKNGYKSLIIDLNDLCLLPHSLTVEHISTQFTQKMNTTPKLFRSLWSIFGRTFFLLGIIKILGDGMAFGGPIFLNKLISYMENGRKDLREGLLLCLILISTVSVASFLNIHFSYRISLLTLKCKVCLYTQIYQKATKLNLSQMGNFSMGEIVNHMSTDTDRIVNFFQSFHAFWSLPVQIAIVLYLLYLQIGLTFLTGLAFAIILIPINKVIASKIGKLSQSMMMYKDDRVKLVSEVIYGIRAIKLNTYEEYFTSEMDKIRTNELKTLRGRKYLDAFCVYFWATTPVLISVLTFTTYTLLGNHLTPSKVFTSLALFAMLIAPLNAFPWVINGLVEAQVSLKRVQKFINIQPINMDEYYHQLPIEEQFQLSLDLPSISILLKDARFTWNESNESILNVNNLSVKRGDLVLILGRVGSGKTTLLNSLLGELLKLHGQIIVEKVIENGYAYCAQEPWIQQLTFRENILFGTSYDHAWYKQVIDACALEKDIQYLGDAGDQTYIGENGATLSGGQKARVALARAAYQDKDIYLLDDPLSAVDVNVARYLFTKCIKGILKHKTRLLCTHQVQYAKQADYVILVDKGQIVKQGKPEDVLSVAESLLFGDQTSELSVTTTTPSHKSVTELDELIIQPENALQTELEQRCTGTVKLFVWKRYFIAVGIILSFSIVISVFLMQASRNIFDWWLSYWTSHQLEIRNMSIINNRSFVILNPSV
ncbi:unnamed protein product [Didymodactylos carnosus]|uniref:ABC-type xenobiotic transporter n=1 Tax=Didymodactylos carnosus TaxID=1234261 RepID=A0A813U9A3_9BILA|nr:unnamed protein product [Didymodactylos carnosus]CAF3609600.1 unnamed protein product [Didymodactylos carnosus]